MYSDNSYNKAMNIAILVFTILFILTMVVPSQAQQIDIKDWKYVATAEARAHSIDPLLVKAIINVESSGCVRNFNSKTLDYGCMQINIKNVTALNLDKQKLLTNPAYAIKHGVKVLKSFERFKAKEPLTWYCRYNVGTGKLIKNRAKVCLMYADKVQKEIDKLKNEIDYSLLTLK